MSDLLYRLSTLEPSANLSRDAITEILNLQKRIEEQRDKYKEEIEKLQAELQATKEQLKKCESALDDYAICNDVGAVARKYFKDKQKYKE